MPWLLLAAHWWPSDWLAWVVDAAWTVVQLSDGALDAVVAAAWWWA